MLAHARRKLEALARGISMSLLKGNNNKALYKFLLLHIHEVYYYM